MYLSVVGLRVRPGSTPQPCVTAIGGWTRVGGRGILSTRCMTSFVLLRCAKLNPLRRSKPTEATAQKQNSVTPQQPGHRLPQQPRRKQIHTQIHRSTKYSPAQATRINQEHSMAFRLTPRLENPRPCWRCCQGVLPSNDLSTPPLLAMLPRSTPEQRLQRYD